MSNNEKLSVHEIQRTVDVWKENGESISATAKAMGIHRRTIGRRLDKATELKIIGEARTPTPHAGTKVYVLTSAQDDTTIFSYF